MQGPGPGQGTRCSKARNLQRSSTSACYPEGRPMLRRYIADQPTSRLAVWARRMALFSLAATVLAVLLAFGAFVVIWKDGLDGMGYALTAIAIGLALIAYPAYLGIKTHRLPWIYDVTTDFIDPPRYEALARIRPRDANPIIYAGLSAAEQQ